MESPYRYNWKRYYVLGTTDCSNLEEAICIAASDLENGEAWPVSIVHDDQILWSFSGSIGIGESLAVFANANNINYP